MNTAKERSRDAEFAAFLEQSELAQQFRDQQRQKLTTARAEKIAAKDMLEAEELRVTEEISNLNGKLEADLAHLANEIKTVQGEAYKKIKPLQEKKFSLSRQIHDLTGFLSTNYESVITDAISFFRQKEDDLCRMPVSSTINTGPERLSGLREIYSRSNRPGVLAALDYCRAAVKQLEELKTTEADFDSKWVEKLKDGIPDYTKFTETSGLATLTPGAVNKIFN